MQFSSKCACVFGLIFTILIPLDFTKYLIDYVFMCTDSPYFVGVVYVCYGLEYVLDLYYTNNTSGYLRIFWYGRLNKFTILFKKVKTYSSIFYYTLYYILPLCSYNFFEYFLNIFYYTITTINIYRLFFYSSIFYV